MFRALVGPMIGRSRDDQFAVLALVQAREARSQRFAREERRVVHAERLKDALGQELLDTAGRESLR